MKAVRTMCALAALTAFVPIASYGQTPESVTLDDGDLRGGVGEGVEQALPGASGLTGDAGAAGLADVDAVSDLDHASDLAPDTSVRPVPRDTWALPAARWDDHPRGDQWTAAVLSALRGPGAALLQTEPRDIHTWCPGYLDASPEQRAAFWTGLVSALAWHESTHDPRVVGGGGRWFGLVQIAPGTARWHECDVGSGEALLSGTANLRCGIRIMGTTVPRDNVVSEGMQGVAADWGPFHSARKREDMRDWVLAQDYCALPVSDTRPVMRPADLGEAPADLGEGPADLGEGPADLGEGDVDEPRGASTSSDTDRPTPRPL